MDLELINFDDYEVLTEEGFKGCKGIKRTTSEVVRLQFEDTSLDCTKDHLILLKDGRFARAKDLEPGQVTSTGHTFVRCTDLEEERYVYDILEVEGSSSYITNDITSHNCAFVSNWDEFFASVFPTISSGTTTKILLTSTPNGLNHFYQICEGAKEGVNGYAYVEVSWQRIPGRDEKWRHETLATMNFDTEKFAQEYECVSADTLINIRNKVTGEVRVVTIGELFYDDGYM